jgi:hypothetical protein
VRRDRGRLSNDAQIGLAWSSREAWERLREIADDRAKLDDSFRGVVGAQCVASDPGPRLGRRQARKVPIDVDAYVIVLRMRLSTG